jgi:hypothetical protein
MIFIAGKGNGVVGYLTSLPFPQFHVTFSLLVVCRTSLHLLPISAATLLSASLYDVTGNRYLQHLGDSIY